MTQHAGLDMCHSFKYQILSFSGAVDSLKKCHKIRKHILYKYHKDLAETQDCLARCYAIVGMYLYSPSTKKNKHTYPHPNHHRKAK